MTGWVPLAVVALISGGASAVTTVALTERFGGDGVRAYLLDNPEVLQEASERLRMKQAVAQLSPLRTQIEAPYAKAYIGAERPDVTVVQFFDYACGYCRASLPVLQKLVREDPKVRVVFRELPILSRESEAAARASLAAAEQGRYGVFHEAMYAAGRPGGAAIGSAIRAAGLDVAKVQAAVNAPRVEREIARNLDLARTLGFSGTPSWVVGNQLLPGAVDYETLKDAVAKARNARG